jgi:hypothetical protein
MANDCSECPYLDEDECPPCGQYDNEPTMADGVTPLQW